MNKCCFCLELRTGTIISAALDLVTRSALIVLSSTVLGLREKYPRDCSVINHEDFLDEYDINNDDLTWYCRLDFDKTKLITSLVVSCLHVLFSTFLLIGVRQKKRTLFWPWLILTSVEVLSGIGYALMTLITRSYDMPRISGMLIIVLTQGYMLSCVMYYCKHLAARQNCTVYNVIPLSSSSVPCEVTPTPSSLYNNAGLYYSTHTMEQPPKYENKATLFNNDAIQLEDKPPSYEEIRKN